MTWLTAALLLLALLIILMPFILRGRDKEFFHIPFITWFLLHYGIAALALVLLAALALVGVLTTAVLTVFASLFGYVLGSTSSRSSGGNAPKPTLHIDRLQPESGPASSRFVVSGTGIAPKAELRFGSTAVGDLVVAKDGSMASGSVPAGAGQVDVLVRNPDGTAYFMAKAFTYQP